MLSVGHVGSSVAKWAVIACGAKTCETPPPYPPALGHLQHDTLNLKTQELGPRRLGARRSDASR